MRSCTRNITYEEREHSRSIKAEAKGLDPKESDARGCLELAAGDVLLASIAGDDS